MKEIKVGNGQWQTVIVDADDVRDFVEKSTSGDVLYVTSDYAIIRDRLFGVVWNDGDYFNAIEMIDYLAETLEPKELKVV